MFFLYTKINIHIIYLFFKLTILRNLLGFIIKLKKKKMM